MNQNDFVIWLNGFVANKNQLSEQDMQTLKEELGKIHSFPSKPVYIPSIFGPNYKYDTTCKPLSLL